MRRLPVLIAAACLAASGCMEELPDDVETSEHEIVGGQLTTQYPAVPMLFISNSNGEGGACTGTLISPRVVLTAAHCLDLGGTVDGGWAYFGSTTNGGDSVFIEQLDIVNSTYQSNWSLSAHDIGLVLLEREAQTAPIPYNTTTLNSSYINDDITLVGFGDTTGGAMNGGDKRVVTSYLQGFQNSYVLNYGTNGANTCQGDSGGPGFMQVNNQQVVAAVTSWGTGNCHGVSGSTRVAQYTNWIQNWINNNDVRVPPDVTITRPSQGDTVGSFFVVEAEATDDIEVARVELYLNGALSATLFSGPYIFNAQGLPSGQATLEVRAYDNADEMGSTSITVNVDNACMNNDDCPDGTSCEDGECLPITGGLGDDCIADDDCVSGLCGMIGDLQYCTQLCDLTSQDCPGDFECIDAGGGQGACVRTSGGDGEETGGCSTTNSGAGFGWIALLMVFGLVARRRKR
jgi:MYXO-CTERM domain-containing protein